MANEINIDAMNNLFKNINLTSDSLKNISNSLSVMNDEMLMLNDTCSILAESVVGISTSMGDFGSKGLMATTTSVLQLVNGFGGLSNTFIKIGELLPATQGLFNSFTGILSSLSMGPLIGIIAGIGLLTYAFTGLNDCENSITKASKEYVEAQEKKRKELDATTESLKKNHEATQNNVRDLSAEYAVTSEHFNALMEITNKDGGYAKNIEEAKYHVDQLNSVLPNSVEITDDGKIAWKENTDEIQKNIEMMKKKAIVEAYEKDYVETIRNRTDLQAKLTAATNEQKNAQSAYNEQHEKYKYLLATGDEAAYSIRMKEVTANLDAANSSLDSAKNAYNENEKGAKLYDAALKNLNGTSEAAANLQVEQYTKVGKDGTSSWESLTNAIVDLDRQQQEHVANGKTAADAEVETTTMAANMIREQCVAKAKHFGDSYDTMIANLEENGIILSEHEKTMLEEQYNNWKSTDDAKVSSQNAVFDSAIATLEEKGVILNEQEKGILEEQYNAWQDMAAGKEGVQALSFENLIAKLEEGGRVLTNTEKEHLKDQYDAWQQNAIDKETTLSTSYSNMKEDLNTLMTSMNEDQRTKLNESIDILSKGGSEGGLELCNKLAQSLKDNDGKVTKETQDIIDDVNEMADNANPTMNVGAAAPGKYTLASIATNIKSGIGNVDVPIGFSLIQTALNIAGMVHNITLRASGGFPDTGELFIAREAGPELVGRINGKTAVANNDQIVSGISNGVYNAMKSVMQTNGSTNNMNLHATFVMDGEVVGKQVIKYHNGVVRRTGTTPLLI